MYSEFYSYDSYDCADLLSDHAAHRHDHDYTYCDYDYTDADKSVYDEWIEYWGEYVGWADEVLAGWGDGDALVGGAVPIENDHDKLFGLWENGGYDIDLYWVDVAKIACSD